MKMNLHYPETSLMRHGVIAIALVLAACSRSEPDKTAVRSNAPAPVAPAAPTEKPNYAPDEALKERLARQEAAAKLLDAKAPPPPPARAPEPPKAAAKAPEPPKAAPTAIAPQRSEPAKSPESVKVAATPPPPQPPVVAAKPEPVKVEPPPPRTEVAVAKPAAAPAPVLRLVQRVEPDFPREAIQAGAENGLVQARMTLDERGNVTRVEVLEAKPRRLFDRSVIRALSQWKYNDGASGRTVEIEIAFRK